MGIIQAAAEAARQGGSSMTLVIPTGVITAVLTGVTIRVMDRLSTRHQARRNGNGNGSTPGTAKICRERGEQLARMDEKQKSLEGDITEIKTDVKTLLGRVPPRER